MGFCPQAQSIYKSPKQVRVFRLIPGLGDLAISKFTTTVVVGSDRIRVEFLPLTRLQQPRDPRRDALLGGPKSFIDIFQG